MPRSRGFTLVELLIILGVIGLFGALVLPALLENMHRARVEQPVRTIEGELRAMRFRAVQEGREYGVFADFANDRAVAFRGTDPTDAGTTELLETRAVMLPFGVAFEHPADGDPEGAGAIDGFHEEADVGGWVFFRADGAAVIDAADETLTEGAFRIGMPERGIFYEVRIQPASTGRIRVSRWDGSEFPED